MYEKGKPNTVVANVIIEKIIIDELGEVSVDNLENISRQIVKALKLEGCRFPIAGCGFSDDWS